MRDFQPLWQALHISTNGSDLTQHQKRQPVEIHHVDAPCDHEIADHSEKKANAAAVRAQVAIDTE